jgi:hypothetical protein
MIRVVFPCCICLSHTSESRVSGASFEAAAEPAVNFGSPDAVTDMVNFARQTP